MHWMLTDKCDHNETIGVSFAGSFSAGCHPQQLVLLKLFRPREWTVYMWDYPWVSMCIILCSFVCAGFIHIAEHNTNMTNPIK